MAELRRTAFLMGLALALAVMLLPPAAGRAQTPAGNPMVTGKVIRDYARITFYWPEKIDMTATADGTRLRVDFDRRVNPNFGEILARLYPYVTKAELTANQRTIIFTMQKPYRIRSFITDSESGVDILGIYDDPPPAQQQAATAPSQRPATTPVPREKPVTPVTIPQPAAEPAPAPPPAEETPPPAPVPVTPQPAPQPEAEPAPAPDPATAAPVTEVTTASVARLQDFGPVSGAPMTVELSTVDKEPHLRFPFIERVDAAVWQRGRTVMLLFGKPVRLQGLEHLRSEGRSWLHHAEQLGGSDFTLLRLDLNADLHVQAFKDREGYGWRLRLTASPTRPQETVAPAINRAADRTSVFLPVTQMGRTFRLRDPQIGDALDIITLYSGDTGIYPPRGFVEFDLPATGQGIVVAPKSDAVRVEQLDNGVRISAPDGLLITPDLDESAVLGAMGADARDALFMPSLFPAREWAAKGITEYRQRVAELGEHIASATSKTEKNELRMALARLHFTQELYNETLGVLAAIRRDDLDFFRANRLAALEGAAHLLNYRVPEAALSFSSDTLNGLEEGELLRKAASAAMNREAEPVPYMQYNASYIRQYPPDLRQRLAIIAANHAVQKGDSRTPTDIFDSLDEDRLTGEVADYIEYLKAKVAAVSGRTKEAARIWGELASKIEDRQFRARSEYALVLLELEEGTLPVEDAVKRLEALRIVWRGDDLERSLLTVLGQLQVNQGNYWEGMKAWEELLDYYPNSPEALGAYQRLAATFRSLFLDDEADRMDPVKALALYNEFQELSPLGADGNRMMQKLVDRLVAVDLLDEAAARLEHLVKFRLAGEKKSRVGARLAVIRLLNREPEQALSALQNSRVDNVPASLSLERNRIAAQALIDLKRTEQALGMIEGDYSPDGENVRLEAYWQKEDWPYAIDIIELMLRKRTDLDAPFTPREGQRLLQLALAYIFVGEFEQLRYLREAYAPVMENNPYKDEFLFLTQERIPTSGENFSKVIDSIGAIESFMDGYRDRLQSGDLSDTVGSGTQDGSTAPANPQ